MPKHGPDYLHSTTKRLLDVLGVVALSEVAIPAMIIGGVTAAIDTKDWNPLFVQERVTGVAQKLRIVKFRTIARALTEGQIITLDGTADKRASRAGKLLRATGVDEAPQLLQVAAGQLSLVGPRPALPQSLERMESADGVLFNDWYPAYLDAPKGLTSSSSVVRHKTPHDNSPELLCTIMRHDLNDYAEASLGRDLTILAQTPWSLLQGAWHLRQPQA